MKSACSLSPRFLKVTLSKDIVKTKVMWHGSQLSPQSIIDLWTSVFLLYPYWTTASKHLRYINPDFKIGKNKKNLHRRRLFQLQPDSFRTCRTWRLFRLTQLNVATPEGSSHSSAGGLFPTQRMQNPWMQRLTRLVFPTDKSFSLQQHVGGSWIDI